MPARVTGRFVTDPSLARGGWQIGGSENSKSRKEDGSEEAEQDNCSSLRGLRVMERDVSETRQRAFFQSICPASRPRVKGAGPIKRLDIVAQTLG